MNVQLSVLCETNELSSATPWNSTEVCVHQSNLYNPRQKSQTIK